MTSWAVGGGFRAPPAAAGSRRLDVWWRPSDRKVALAPLDVTPEILRRRAMSRNHTPHALQQALTVTRCRVFLRDGKARQLMLRVGSQRRADLCARHRGPTRRYCGSGSRLATTPRTTWRSTRSNRRCLRIRTPPGLCTVITAAELDLLHRAFRRRRDRQLRRSIGDSYDNGWPNRDHPIEHQAHSPRDVDGIELRRARHRRVSAPVQHASAARTTGLCAASGVRSSALSHTGQAAATRRWDSHTGPRATLFALAEMARVN